MKLPELIGKRIIDIVATTQLYDEFKDYGLKGQIVPSLQVYTVLLHAGY